MSDYLLAEEQPYDAGVPRTEQSGEPQPQLLPVWRWEVFGHGPMRGGGTFTPMLIEFPYEVPLWYRLLTRIVLRSHWVRP